MFYYLPSVLRSGTPIPCRESSSDIPKMDQAPKEKAGTSSEHYNYLVAFYAAEEAAKKAKKAAP